MGTALRACAAPASQSQHSHPGSRQRICLAKNGCLLPTFAAALSQDLAAGNALRMVVYEPIMEGAGAGSARG